MRILEGVGTLIQLGGLVARLCKMVRITHGYFLSQTSHRPTEHKTPALCRVVFVSSHLAFSPIDVRLGYSTLHGHKHILNLFCILPILFMNITLALACYMEYGVYMSTLGTRVMKSQTLPRGGAYIRSDKVVVLRIDKLLSA
jgi:hypothetical protein